MCKVTEGMQWKNLWRDRMHTLNLNYCPFPVCKFTKTLTTEY